MLYMHYELSLYILYIMYIIYHVYLLHIYITINTYILCLYIYIYIYIYIYGIHFERAKVFRFYIESWPS